MSIPNQLTGPVRFASFEVDLRVGELRKHGIRIRLQDQPFQILSMLLAHPGELVSREDLRRRLWPEGTFVDFEHSLNAAVKRLRSALGDNADSPRFVETLHRRGYRFIAPVDGKTPAPPRPQLLSPASSITAATPRLRLAVLPFANLSGDPEREYFSDGLTEEMIAQLGRLAPDRLGIIARTSAMRYKRTAKSAAEIGRDLAVDYLLEGSVRSTDDRVRITAQLIATRDETHLWAETFDRSITDYFTMQAEVAARIAASLSVELLPGQPALHPAECCTISCDAHREYLKGLYYWHKATDESVETAIGFYRAALQVEPGFAPALGSLARALIDYAGISPRPPLEVLAEARQAATRALQLDPSLCNAHIALAGIFKRMDWDWSGAEAAYRRALALHPNSDAAHRLYASFLAALGRSKEAIAETEHALDIDPLCLIVNSTATWVYYLARDYEWAAYQARYTLELEPGFALARRVFAATLLQQERHSEALAEFERCVEIGGPQPLILAWLGHAQAVSGNPQAARSILAQLHRQNAERYVSSYLLALVHTGLGDHDAAFAALSRAADERATSIANLPSEPRFDSLRSDPRFDALLSRLRLPPVPPDNSLAASGEALTTPE